MTPLLRNIRYATPSDFKQIREISSKTEWFEHQDDLSLSIKRRQVIIYEDNGIKGFCRFTHSKSKPCNIQSLFVLPTERGKGIGNSLIEYLKENESKYIILKCPAKYKSNSFYQKIGFTLRQIIKKPKTTLNVWCNWE